MRRLKTWFDEPHEIGMLLAFLFMGTVLLLGVAIGLAGPRAVDTALPGPPEIPPDLADHGGRGVGEQRGESVGATPSKQFARPTSALSDRAIKYAWKGSPNWGGRGANPIQAITVHVTGPGSMAGMDAWFNNPAASVSAHFGIGKDGAVHQYVELGDSAWHNGVINRPDLTNPFISGWVVDGINPNLRTVGIELLLAGPAEPLTDYPEMEATLRALLDWLAGETGIVLTRDSVIGHYQIDSINRSTDPRCCVDLAAILPGPQAQDLSACNQHKIRWSRQLGAWLAPGSRFFVPSIGVWTTVPKCSA